MEIHTVDAHLDLCTVDVWATEFTQWTFSYYGHSCEDVSGIFTPWAFAGVSTARISVPGISCPEDIGDIGAMERSHWDV